MRLNGAPSRLTVPLSHLARVDFQGAPWVCLTTATVTHAAAATGRDRVGAGAGGRFARPWINGDSTCAAPQHYCLKSLSASFPPA